METGWSFGDPCRYCGSREIITSPPSSAGKCACCSPEINAYNARLGQWILSHAAPDRFATAQKPERAALVH